VLLFTVAVIGASWRLRQNEHPMDVIGHDHKLVQVDAFEMEWNPSPALLHDGPDPAEPDPPILASRKKMATAGFCRGDQIRTGLAIVVSRDSD
jgi:hypothetical protein